MRYAGAAAENLVKIPHYDAVTCRGLNELAHHGCT